MNDKLPFEDSFERNINNLLPGNEDASWQKMNDLLEEKDKRRPFAWINVYTVCGCLIIAALAGIWMELFYQHKTKQNQTAISAKNKAATQLSIKEKNKASQISNRYDQLRDKVADKGKSVHTLADLNAYVISINRGLVRQHINYIQTKKTHYTRVYRIITSDSISDANNKVLPNNMVTKTLDSVQFNRSKNKTNQIALINKENIQTLPQNAGNTDTIAAVDTSSRKKPFNTDTTSLAKQTKHVVKNRKQFFIDAGIQLSQSLPFYGEQLSLYNYNGNKNLLSDYIPLVYMKFEKNRRWFVQAEFAYASPQVVKPFSYVRKTNVDYIHSTVTIANNYLLKTYYTQIPVSLNFYLKPNLFIGVGAKYGWFHGAVTKQETVINNIKADSQYTNMHVIPIKAFTDSFLYKSQTAFIFQTGYTWRRWNFSVRYTNAFQPFISFTLPAGAIDNKRNSSFQFLIGYDLFKSKEVNARLKK